MKYHFKEFIFKNSFVKEEVKIFFNLKFFFFKFLIFNLKKFLKFHKKLNLFFKFSFIFLKNWFLIKIWNFKNFLKKKLTPKNKEGNKIKEIFNLDFNFFEKLKSKFLKNSFFEIQNLDLLKNFKLNLNQGKKTKEKIKNNYNYLFLF